MEKNYMNLTFVYHENCIKNLHLCEPENKLELLTPGTIKVFNECVLKQNSVFINIKFKAIYHFV